MVTVCVASTFANYLLVLQWVLLLANERAASATAEEEKKKTNIFETFLTTYI